MQPTSISAVACRPGTINRAANTQPVSFYSYFYHSTRAHILASMMIVSAALAVVPQAQDSAMPTDARPPISAGALTADSGGTVHDLPPSGRTRSAHTEIVERRSRHAKHFRNADGSATAMISLVPKHFKTAAGVWEDINTTVYPNLTPEYNEYRYSAQQNTIKAYFGEKANHGFVVDLGDTHLQVTGTADIAVTGETGETLARFDHTDAAATVTTNQLTYFGAFAGIESAERLTVLGGALKHDVVLYASPVRLDTESFGGEVILSQSLVMPQGGDIRVQADDTLQIVNNVGDTVGVIPTPIVYEDADHRNSVRCKLRVIRTSFGHTIQTIAPLSWFAAPDRQYPIVIDPRYEQNASWWGYGNGSECYRQSTYVYAQGGSGCGVWVGWFFWDVSSVPNLVDVTAARFDFFIWDGSSTINVSLRDMENDSPTGSTCSTLTSQVCTVGESYGSYSGSGSSGWKYVDLPESAMADLESYLASGQNRFGLGLKNTSTSATNFAEIVGDSAIELNAELDFTYCELLPAPTLVSPANGATCLATSNTLDWSDVTGASSYTVQLGTSCGTGSQYTVTTSQRAFSSLTAGTVYYWRVRTNNSCGSGPWSNCYSFTTAPAAPGAPTGVTASDGTYSNRVEVSWNSVSNADEYRVYRDGGAIGSWQPATTYSDTNVTLCQNYSYQVKARNSCDAEGPLSAANSGYAGTNPSITSHPSNQTVCAGGSTQFSVSASSAISYQWQKNGSNLSNGGHYSGVTTPTLTVSNADGNDAASYRCVVSNNCGSTNSNSATLTVNTAPSITSHPTNQTVCAGGSAQFSVSASSATSYQWQKNGSNLSNGGHYSGVTTPTLTVSNADGNDAASYRCVVSSNCGSTNSNSATLTVNTAPSITSHPINQTVCAGGSAQFSVSATGGTSYQWQKNGSNLVNGGPYSGVTSPTLTISNANSNDAGSYRCVVSNSCGSITSNPATLTVNTAPSITSHPSNQTVCAAGSAQFSVSANGVTGYQWQKNGSNLSNGGHYSGVTTPTLTISNADSSDAASFRCVVSNSCGSTNSNGATLTVNVAPNVTDDPDAGTICQGQSYQFCVNASGTPPLNYQWRRNGSGIPGASSSCYTANQAGSYDCVVTNGCGSDTSAPATLTVGTSMRWYRDSDGDTFGNPSVWLDQCDQPPGYVSNGGDCDDTRASVHPGATEVCDNGLDDDCVDGDRRCGEVEVWYRDADGDGYGNPNVRIEAPTQPAGYVPNPSDCDDTRASVHPGATEVCGNGLDDDCVGGDRPCELWYQDADGDGYGNRNVSIDSPTQPAGYVPDDSDCDDSRASVHPGAAEDCDGIDNDCDSQVDEGCKPWYADEDGDGFGNSNRAQLAPAAPPGFVDNDRDCDDNDPNRNPNAREECDGVDNDCDGQIDEGCPPRPPPPPPPPPPSRPRAFAAFEVYYDTMSDTDVQVLLNGEGSIDTDGAISAYQWFDGESQIATGVRATVRLGWGDHLLSLRVQDRDGQIDTLNFTITLVREDVWNRGDDDGDGILNGEDQCPDLPGSSADGCPPGGGLCPGTALGLITLSIVGLIRFRRR